MKKSTSLIMLALILGVSFFYWDTIQYYTRRIKVHMFIVKTKEPLNKKDHMLKTLLGQLAETEAFFLANEEPGYDQETILSELQKLRGDILIFIGTEYYYPYHYKNGNPKKQLLTFSQRLCSIMNVNYSNKSIIKNIKHYRKSLTLLWT